MTRATPPKTKSEEPMFFVGEGATYIQLEGDFEPFQVRDRDSLNDIPDDAQILVVPRTESAQRELERSDGFEGMEKLFQRYKASMEGVDRLGLFCLTAGSHQMREAVSVPWILAEAFEPSPRARAVLRGVRHAENDLTDAGGTFDVEEVRALLRGISRQAVDKRVNDGSLLAVPGPSGRRRFPAVQFNDDGSVIPGLKVVQSALGYRSPWSVLNFLVNAHDMLDGERPIDLLRGGEVAKVEQAAMLSGVHAE